MWKRLFPVKKCGKVEKGLTKDLFIYIIIKAKGKT